MIGNYFAVFPAGATEFVGAVDATADDRGRQSRGSQNGRSAQPCDDLSLH